MNKKDFLIEIGVEEIPAGYIQNAIKKIANQIDSVLKDNNLNCDELISMSTPRRFTCYVKGIPVKQKDIDQERIGPSVSAAYDGKGNLTRAAQGFLRGANAKESDIYRVSNPKGEKIAVRLQKKGLHTEDILKDALPEIILKLNFPKAMKWQLPNFTFARPIRWILALWGNDVIPIEIAGLKASNITRGNRFLQDNSTCSIQNIESYSKILKKLFVIADRDERKAMISKQLADVAESNNCLLVEDQGLLDLVTDLVEFPTAVLAQFDQKYLDLPEKIVTSTLSQHQKYFSTRDEKGSLSHNFIFISNGDPEYSEIIRKGNEKVVKARLEDAEFFFKEDTAKPLDSFVDSLKNVTFQEKLGTLYDKTERNKTIVSYLADSLALSTSHKEDSIRTAELAKADLVTLMLGEKEFTKLQGYMGMNYAKISGEKENVALGIYEHYQPRGQNDTLPETIEGALTAIADKTDTVCGIIAAGMMPTSSKDPFALRRAANGVIQIIADKNLEISVEKLIDKSLTLFTEKLDITEKRQAEIIKFFENRLVWLLQQENIEHDIIESILHHGMQNIPAMIKRGIALQQIREEEEFIKLVIGFKRVSNIISNHDNFTAVNEDMLVEENEKQLHAEYLILQKTLNHLIINNDFDLMIRELIQFGIYIDKFFDDVLVNVDDKELRSNRYNLLKNIRDLFLKVADVAKIVVEGENK